MTDIVIFGAGEKTNNAILKLSNYYNIIGVVDNDSKKWGNSIQGFRIDNPKTISIMKFDAVIIISARWREILEQLYQNNNVTRAYRFVQSDGGIVLRGVSPLPLYCNMLPEKEEDNIIFHRFHVERQKKKILVLAYYFPPMGASPVQRTLKFVKYLHEMGYAITVVTSNGDNYPKIDESLINEIPQGVDVIRICDRYKEKQELYKSEQQRILNFIGKISSSFTFIDELTIAQQEQVNYVLPDKLIMWAIDAYDYIVNNYQRIDADIVYSTVPEWSPHLLAYLVKQRFDIPWIGDYRDPWVASEDYVHAIYPYMNAHEIQWMQNLESVLVGEMDQIVVAGENWKEMFVEKYKVDISKVEAICNGYDESDFEDICLSQEKNDCFTLCYNGLLGYNRRPRVILNAINALIEEKLIDKNKITWVFNGAISDFTLKEEIKPFDKYQIVKVNGMLSHCESLKVASSSDLLVVYGEKGEMAKLNYPGKFYECLRCMVPILCISDKGSPQATILEQTGLGKNCGFNDMKDIMDFIYSKYFLWDNGEKRLTQVVKDDITQYSRKELTKKMASIVDRL